jgi:hypothetical protein
MRSVKRVRNEEVAREWGRLIGGERKRDGELREVSNWGGSFRVYNDGSVYSYRLLIGEIKDREHVLYDCSASGGQFYSKTTSKHVGYLREYALRVVDYRGEG